MNVIRMPLSEKPLGLTLEAELTDKASALLMVFSAALGPDPKIGARGVINAGAPRGRSAARRAT